MNVLQLDLPTAIPRAPEPRVTAPADFHGGTDEDLRRLFGHNPEAAAERLQDLDDEWSIEGLLEGGAAIIGLTTFTLGLTVDDRWLVLPLLVSLLLLQQTIQGWCPLLPFLRGLGFRTEREIQHERHVLQQLDEEQVEHHLPASAPLTATTSEPRHQMHHLAAAPAGAPSFSLRHFLVETAR